MDDFNNSEACLERHRQEYEKYVGTITDEIEVLKADKRLADRLARDAEQREQELNNYVAELNSNAGDTRSLFYFVVSVEYCGVEAWFSTR